MRNLIIVILTVCVVIAGAFLPDLFLRAGKEPELDREYPEVTVSSQNASDYAWRMERLSEHYYGEEETLLTTYIREATDDAEVRPQFLTELRRLTDLGAVPSGVLPVLEEYYGSRIHYYYIFDKETLNGFRYAEFTANEDSWGVTMSMDMESGKLAKVEFRGKEGNFSYRDFSSWYDILRSYADYLGLSAAALPAEEAAALTAGIPNRGYYEDKTVDKLASRVAGGSAWLELRVLKPAQTTAICVYSGGK